MIRSTIESVAAVVGRAGLAAVSAALAQVPQNKAAWTYTIFGFDGTPYLTRTLLPRMAGRRMVLHRIHRPDEDPHLHNHPWETASFRILSGGYVEERLVPRGFGEVLDYTNSSLCRVESRIFDRGDVNRLDAGTLHRISHVEPDTWTLGVLGDRVQEWGFLVDGEIVHWKRYLASKGYQGSEGDGLS